MQLKQRITACGVMILAALCETAFPPPAMASALLYKSYVIRQDQGRDILCDTHLVQKNEWIFKLFRESGEISQADFGEFLNIFRRLNPDISDIDRIQWGQRIFIPLKKLSLDSLPGQQTGVVSIPFVTISALPELLKSYATQHLLQKGDTVSGLLSPTFGNIGTKTYREASQLFQVMNPTVSSFDRVKTGQPVWLPLATVMKEAWYASLFDDSGNLVSGEYVPSTNRRSSPPLIQSAHLTSLQKAAKLLEARVINRGAYYFPRPGMDDLELDLCRFPVLELSDRSRALIATPSSSSNPGFSESDIAAMKSFWKSLSIMTVDPAASAEEILEAYFKSISNNVSNNTVFFSDNGVKVSVRARWWLNQAGEKNSTSPAEGKKVGFIPPMYPDGGNTTLVLAYLAKHGIILREIKDEENETPAIAKSSVLLPSIIPSAPPEALVSALMATLTLPFSPGIAISFPYGGIQIPAVSNLISTGKGRSVLVDFGTLYGEAIDAIINSGLDVVRITPQETHQDTIRKLLTATGHSYETNPTFAAAKTLGDFGAYISIPGFLVSREGETKALLSRVQLDRALIQFLNEKGIKIAQLDEKDIER